MDYKNYKNIGLAGAGLAIIGTFLPFLKVTNPVTGVTIATIQLISGDGMFVLILMAIAGALIFFNKYFTKTFWFLYQFFLFDFNIVFEFFLLFIK